MEPDLNKMYMFLVHTKKKIRKEANKLHSYKQIACI